MNEICEWTLPKYVEKPKDAMIVTQCGMGVNVDGYEKYKPTMCPHCGKKIKAK